MKAVMLVVTKMDSQGRPSHKRYVIREYLDGEVDIVEVDHARCDADRSVTIHTYGDDDVVIAVESAV